MHKTYSYLIVQPKLSLIYLFILFFKFIDLREREEGGEREKEMEGRKVGGRKGERERDQFVFSIIYAFIGCFFYVP